MLTVIALITAVTGLVTAVSGLVQGKKTRKRADALERAVSDLAPRRDA